MTENSSTALWFALQVRTRWENSIGSFLSGKGYETFLPTYIVNKPSARGIRENHAPLFPGYVFCRFNVEKRLPILVTPGVIAVVGRGRIPIAIEEEEINSVRRVVSSGFPAEPFPYFEAGQRVRITEGSLTGLEGMLLSFKGRHRIVVSVTLLRRSVAIEIDRSSAVPICASHDARPSNSVALLEEALA